MGQGSVPSRASTQASLIEPVFAAHRPLAAVQPFGGAPAEEATKLKLEPAPRS